MKNPYENLQAVELGEKYFKEKKIVVCPKGHEINYGLEGIVNEFGHHTGCWCQKCQRYYGIFQVRLSGGSSQ